jgi:hypothetical protein
MFLKNLQWGLLQYYYSGVTITHSQEIIIACVLGFPLVFIMIERLNCSKN